MQGDGWQPREMRFFKCVAKIIISLVHILASSLALAGKWWNENTILKTFFQTTNIFKPARCAQIKCFFQNLVAMGDGTCWKYIVIKFLLLVLHIICYLTILNVNFILDSLELDVLYSLLENRRTCKDFLLNTWAPYFTLEL